MSFRKNPIRNSRCRDHPITMCDCVPSSRKVATTLTAPSLTISQIYNKYITHAPVFTTRYALRGPIIQNLHATIKYAEGRLVITLTDTEEDWFKCVVLIDEADAGKGFISYAPVMGGSAVSFARIVKLKNSWEFAIYTDIHMRPVATFWLDTIYPDETTDDFKVPIIPATTEEEPIPLNFAVLCVTGDCGICGVRGVEVAVCPTKCRTLGCSDCYHGGCTTGQCFPSHLLREEDVSVGQKRKALGYESPDFTPTSPCYSPIKLTCSVCDTGNFDVITCEKCDVVVCISCVERGASKVNYLCKGCSAGICSLACGLCDVAVTRVTACSNCEECLCDGCTVSLKGKTVCLACSDEPGCAAKEWGVPRSNTNVIIKQPTPSFPFSSIIEAIRIDNKKKRRKI